MERGPDCGQPLSQLRDWLEPKLNLGINFECDCFFDKWSPEDRCTAPAAWWLEWTQWGFLLWGTGCGRWYLWTIARNNWHHSDLSLIKRPSSFYFQKLPATSQSVTPFWKSTELARPAPLPAPCSPTSPANQADFFIVFLMNHVNPAVVRMDGRVRWSRTGVF